MSAFDEYRKTAWPYEFAVTIRAQSLCGGVPANEQIAEGWLRSKLGDKDTLIRAMVAEVMVEREVDAEEAAKIVDTEQHVNGFKRSKTITDDQGEKALFIEGRQIKASIKEAVGIAVSSEKIAGRGWGKTNKGIHGFVAEHVIVVEDQIPLLTPDGELVTEPTGIHQRFIHKTLPGKGRISAIHYEEYVEDVLINYSIRTDYDFAERDLAMIMLTGEAQGIGASRSQGFGRYSVERFEAVEVSDASSNGAGSAEAAKEVVKA